MEHRTLYSETLGIAAMSPRAVLSVASAGEVAGPDRPSAPIGRRRHQAALCSAALLRCNIVRFRFGWLFYREGRSLVLLPT